MDLSKLEQLAQDTWRIEPSGTMRVPGILYANADLVRAMDTKVYEQTVNVAALPGIVKASYTMPDAH